MNILKNITTYLNWRNMRFLALVIAGVFLFSDFVFADNAPVKDLSQTDGLAYLVTIVNLITKVWALLLWLLTSLISLFLHPGWVNGEIFGLWTSLKELWIMISNLVYLIFAFLLIVIAFMNIIGKWEGNWELKQALPKFIIWVLIVPFSWFFVQFIISISSILTVSVITLPLETVQQRLEQQAWTNGSEDESANICVDIEFFLWSDNKAPETNNADGSKYNKYIQCKRAIWANDFVAEILSGNENSVYGIVQLYVYGLLKIDQLEELDEDQFIWEWAIGRLIDIIFDGWFALVFVVFYLILLSALFIALLVRGIVLWVYMILSPVFWLLFFLWKDVWWDKFNVKEFIALAFVPVYVSAALSFGLLFLVLINLGMSPQSGQQNTAWGVFEYQDGSLSSINVWWGSFKVTGVTAEAADNLLINNGVGWALGGIILQMMWIVVLWISVMAALRQSEITKQVTAPIEQFGNQVWSLVAKSPLYAPVVPWLSGWPNQSIASLSKVADRWMKYYGNAPQRKAERFISDNNLFNAGSQANISSAARQAAEQAWKNPTAAKAIVDALHEWKSTSELSSNSEFLSALKAQWKEMWLNNDTLDKLKVWWRQEMIDVIDKMEEIFDNDPSTYWNTSFFSNIDKKTHTWPVTETILNDELKKSDSTTANWKQNATSDKTIDLNVRFNEYTKGWKIINHDPSEPDRSKTIVRDENIKWLAKTILAKNEGKMNITTEEEFVSKLNDELASDDEAIKEIIKIIKNQKSDFFKQSSDTDEDSVEE